MTVTIPFTSTISYTAKIKLNKKNLYSLVLPKSKMTLTILLRNLWCLIMLCGICVFGAMQQKCIKLHLSNVVCVSLFLLRRARHQSLCINFIRIYIFFFCLSRPDWMTSSYKLLHTFIGILSSSFFASREYAWVCVFLYTNECAGSRLWYEVLAYLQFSLVSLSLSHFIIIFLFIDFS